MKITGLLDKDGRMIHVGQTLVNPMVHDLWKVEEDEDGTFTANLIPHSGVVRHSEDAKYPYATELLENVNEVFFILEKEKNDD